MTRKYVVRPSALRDVDEIADHIARDNLAAALRFYDAAESAFRDLATMPGMADGVSIRNPNMPTCDPIRSGASETISCSTSRRQAALRYIRVIHDARDVDRIVRQE